MRNAPTITHMHGLPVFVKEEGLISRKFYGFLLRLALLHSMSYLFFLYRSSSSSWSTIFDSVSSNIDEVLAINLSANLFDLTVYYKKHWLTYSDGTDGPGELCCNFCSSNDLTQMANFPTWIPDCDCQSLLFWIYLYEKISLTFVHLLLLVNFVSGFRLELMYISLIVSIRPSLTHLHRFLLLVLLP